MMMALENTDSVCRGVYEKYGIGTSIHRNGHGDVCMHALIMFTTSESRVCWAK